MYDITNWRFYTRSIEIFRTLWCFIDFCKYILFFFKYLLLISIKGVEKSVALGLLFSLKKFSFLITYDTLSVINDVSANCMLSQYNCFQPDLYQIFKTFKEFCISFIILVTVKILLSALTVNSRKVQLYNENNTFVAFAWRRNKNCSPLKLFIIKSTLVFSSRVKFRVQLEGGCGRRSFLLVFLAGMHRNKWRENTHHFPRHAFLTVFGFRGENVYSGCIKPETLSPWFTVSIMYEVLFNVSFLSSFSNCLPKIKIHLEGDL